MPPGPPGSVLRERTGCASIRLANGFWRLYIRFTASSPGRGRCQLLTAAPGGASFERCRRCYSLSSRYED